MTALNRNEMLTKMVNWIEDEMYWFEEDVDQITIHKMRVKDSKRPKKRPIGQTRLEDFE